MPIRRSGIMEAPGQIVGVTNPGNPVADISGMWRQLGQTARGIGERLQPAMNDFARSQAERDFAAGDAHRRTVLVAEDEYYNNAMDQLFAVQASLDIDGIMDRLENEHPVDGDVNAFDTAVRGAREAYIAETQPDFATQAGALFDRAHIGARQRIGERRRTLATQRLQQAGNARLTQMEMQLSGFTNLSDPEFASRWQEYEATGDALAANPLSGMFPDEWTLRREHALSRLYANSLQYTAEQMYEDGGANAESAQAAMAFLEQAVEAGGFTIGDQEHQLTLTEAENDAFFGEGRRRIMARERERLSAIRELNSQLRAMRGEARDEARDTMAEFDARGQAFSIIPDVEMDELRQMVEASQSATLARQYNELVIENTYRRNVQGMSITQVEMFNDRLQAEVTANGDRAGDAAVALRAGRAYVEHLRRGDPLVVAQQHFGEAPPPIITPDGGLAVENLGPRIRFAEQSAEELGSSTPSYFSPGEREAFAAAVRQGGEPGLQAVRAVVAAAFSEDGNGFQRAQAMLAEIGTRGDDAMMAAGTTLLLGGESSSGTARYILEAQRLRQVDGYVRPTLPGQNEGETRDRLIDSTLGSHGAFLTPEMRAQLRRSADLVFEGMVAQNPGTATESTYRAAVRSSLGGVRRTINGQEQRFGGIAVGRNDERIIIPNWIRTDQFEVLRNSLDLGDYSAAGRGYPPLTGQVRDWRNAYWIWTGEPGRYYLADEPDGARHYEVRDGEPYILDLNLIRDRLHTRRPDAVVR